MKFNQNQNLESRTNEIVEFFEEKFEEKVYVEETDFMKIALGGVKDEVVINGSLFVEKLDDYIEYRLKLNGDKAMITLSPQPYPLTAKTTVAINVFNFSKEYKAYYFKTQLYIDSNEITLTEGNECEELLTLLNKMVDNKDILDLLSTFSDVICCPDCGQRIIMHLPYNSYEYKYICFNCHKQYSVEEVTGINDYINPLKYIFEAEDEECDERAS